MRLSEIEHCFNVKLPRGDYILGALVGRVTLIDIVDESTSKWFQGSYGWVLKDAERIEPIPMKGNYGIFSVMLPRRDV